MEGRRTALTPFVLDASIALKWCFPDEFTPATSALLDDLLTTYAVVPRLWTFEIANIVSLAERKGRIAAEQGNTFLTTLSKLSFTFENVELEPLLELSRDTKLTAYDASYLMVALQTGLPLATLDGDLRTAAQKRAVRLLV